jgi:microcystin-dependent protein
LIRDEADYITILILLLKHGDFTVNELKRRTTMSDSYLSEIRIVGFDFAPVNWATCDGQTMSLAQNQALFSLLGTMYGGNGTSNFNLPDLRGRTPMHYTPQQAIGSNGGVESIPVDASITPLHTHGLKASSVAANTNVPAANCLAGAQLYAGANNVVTMAPGALGSGTQPHGNMQPSLVVNFCIALTGMFPSRD